MIKSEKKSEIVTIAGVEMFAKFEGNGDCLSVDFVQATGDGLAISDALVPHEMDEIKYTKEVPQIYKEVAIARLNDWYERGLFTPTKWEPSKLRYRPDFRGYASIWEPSKCKALSSVNLVDECCKNVRIDDILNVTKRWFFDDCQQSEYESRCDRWKEKNASYLDQKSQYFARWWVERVGELGSNGDGMADLIHAMGSKSETPDPSDAQKLYSAIYKWAIAEFNRGCVPYLDTDYSPGWELNEILKDAGLTHLTRSFPWKTWLHLDFSDIDRSAL